jgi:YbbR domain-containing protein
VSQQRSQFTLSNNLVWLIACFMLAFVVWVIATVQNNPIVQETLQNIPIRIDVPEGYVLTTPPRTTSARVLVRGQAGSVSLLTPEDIILRADLTNATAGEYTVPLTATVNRPGVFGIDTQPTQLTISLEQVQQVQSPVEIHVTNPPPADYGYDAPISGIVQAQVSGAVSQVDEVAFVRGVVDLSAQRNPYEANVILVAMDANGQRVQDVTIEPRTTSVSVNIFARDDVRQIAVRPNIALNTLEEGYVLNSIRYDPQVIYLSGSALGLQAIGSTIDTAEISLENRTESFSTEVGLDIPSGVLVLGDVNTITVTLGISAQTSVRQIDNVPVDVVGLPEGFEVSLTPNSILVVLNGPLNQIETITSENVNVIVDLSNFTEGITEVAPIITIFEAQNTIETTPLPSTINVTITRTTETTPEATPNN